MFPLYVPWPQLSPLAWDTLRIMQRESEDRSESVAMLWQWHICHHGKPAARSRRVCHGLVATRTCGLWLPWTRVQGGYFAQNKEEQKENLRKTDPIKVLDLTILLLFYPLFVSKRDQFFHISNYYSFCKILLNIFLGTIIYKRVYLNQKRKKLL